jgi:hypothetical protein
MIRALTCLVAALASSGAIADSRIGAKRLHYSLPRTGYLFVSTTGSDANTCRTAADPCLTIAGAQARLRPLLMGIGHGRSWTVLIAGGTYQLTTPLVFTVADSGGSVTNRVTWQAASDAAPVISGGQQITGWTNNAGIWEATVSGIQSGRYNPRNFWVNDERRLRPRNPGFTSYLTPVSYATVGAAPTNQINQITYSASDVNASMANPLDADAWVPMSWIGEHFMIAGVDGVSKTVTFTGWSGSSRTVNQTTNRFFIENVFEALSTQQGTWYANRTPSGTQFDGRLQYNPKSGETINTLRTVIPVLDQLLFVSNTDDGTATVGHLTFKGLTFAHTDRRPAEYGSYLGDGSGITNPAAINVAGATDIVFDRVTVRNTGGAGIQIGAGCNSCQVINSIIGDTGGPGIMATTWVAGSPATTIPYFAHNLIPNPKFAGGSVGTTGPGWNGVGTANGLTISIMGTGHEAGIPYVDMRVSGTNSTASIQDRVINSTSMPIVNGDMFDMFGYIRLASGSMTGINFATLGATLRNASDTFLRNTFGDFLMQKTSATIASSNLPGQPVAAYGYTINSTNATSLSAYLKIQIAASATVDVTIRFGGLRMNKRSDWRRAIASTTGPQTIQNTIIRNNLIKGVGRIDAASGCITATHTRGATIEGNECSDSYRVGVQVGLVVGGGSYNAGSGIYTPDPNPIADNIQMMRNFIHDAGQGVLSDYGAIYLAHNAPGSSFYENVIYNIKGYKSPDACIYADEDASNFEVARNTCVNIGGSLFFHHRGINADVHDNIGHNVQSSTISNAMQMRGAAYSSKVSDQGLYANVNDRFYRNIVTYTEQNCPNLPRLYGDKRDVVDSGPRVFTNNIYNIASSCVNLPGTAGWLPYDFQAGAVEGWSAWTGTGGRDVGTVFQNPNFIGIEPFVYPAVKPSGWVDWAQGANLPDRNRMLGFPTPMSVFP